MEKSFYKVKMLTTQSHIPPAYSPLIYPEGWMLPHYTGFKEWVYFTFGPLADEKYISRSARRVPDTPCQLNNYQRFVQNFIGHPDSPYRGMLIYHGLGTGKTITSISVAESLSLGRKIMILLPASLRTNYISEIKMCGNTAFREKRFWRFVSQSDPTFNEVRAAMLQFDVPLSFMRKKRGVWTFLPFSDSKPFEQLSGEEQSAVREQTEAMIKTRYHFIHYNGITMNMIRQYGRNMFDNSVVIIDEIHDFISSVKNESLIRRTLYKMMLEAKNTKIIGLSGTPIINDPHELAFLANLLHGYITRHKISFVTGSQFNQNIDNIKRFLEGHRFVDYFELDPTFGTLFINTVPENYVRLNDKSRLVRPLNPSEIAEQQENAQQKRSIETILQDLITTFNLTHKSVNTEHKLLLPETREDFVRHFEVKTEEERLSDLLNSGKQRNKTPKVIIKNEKLFMRRLQSLISYFEYQDMSKFATKSEVTVRTKMPKKVFEKYELLRERERRDEKKSIYNRMSQKDDTQNKNTLNTYKAFSRMLCLFCFPPEIPREYPSDLRKAAVKEMDVKSNEDDDSPSSSSSPSMESRKKQQKEKNVLDIGYEQKKREMLAKLRKNADLYLKGEGLETYGPKYHEVMLRLAKSPGPALIYSHFREVEGIEIMKEVLNTHGYHELDIKFDKQQQSWALSLPSKTNKNYQTVWRKPFYIVFTQDKKKNTVLMDIMNSNWDRLPLSILTQIREIERFKKGEKEKSIANLKGDIIKVIMITQSGSQGISLKNIRQVHILEPYWNPIRIKQVIGRAIRDNSHKDLKPEDRHVDVFKYVMSLGVNKLEEDNNLTSDETIENIAHRKDQHIEAMQRLLQRTAVDCEMHKNKHAHVPDCFKLPANYGVFAYNINKGADLETNVANDIFDKMVAPKRVQHTVKMKKNAKTGQVLYFIDETGEILDTQSYEKNKSQKVVGQMRKTNAGTWAPPRT